MTPSGEDVFPRAFCREGNQDCVSENFERWTELATLASKEQDPERLTELAKETDLALTQKTAYLDPPLREPSLTKKFPLPPLIEGQARRCPQAPFWCDRTMMKGVLINQMIFGSTAIN